MCCFFSWKYFLFVWIWRIQNWIDFSVVVCFLFLSALDLVWCCSLDRSHLTDSIRSQTGYFSSWVFIVLVVFVVVVGVVVVVFVTDEEETKSSSRMKITSQLIVSSVYATDTSNAIRQKNSALVVYFVSFRFVCVYLCNMKTMRRSLSTVNQLSAQPALCVCMCMMRTKRKELCMYACVCVLATTEVRE